VGNQISSFIHHRDVGWLADFFGPDFSGRNNPACVCERYHNFPFRFRITDWSYAVRDNRRYGEQYHAPIGRTAIGRHHRQRANSHPRAIIARRLKVRLTKCAAIPKVA
jgi:hypothetical protein